MKKADFCTKLCVNPYAEIEVATISGETIYGVVDEIRDDSVVIDETRVFGDMRVVNFDNISSAELSSGYER